MLDLFKTKVFLILSLCFKSMLVCVLVGEINGEFREFCLVRLAIALFGLDGGDTD